MTRVPAKKIIQTAIVSALTFAAALIWKDAIIGAIDYFFPTGPQLIYKFLVAIIVTILVVVAIYIIFKTEEETEYLIKKYKGKYFLQSVDKKDKS